MPNLKCHEYECKNNQCSRCLVPSLKVSEDAICLDYQQRDYVDSKNCAYEYSEEIGTSLKKDDHYISCKARNCLNNANGSCIASYIRIDTSLNSAKCCQFRER